MAVVDVERAKVQDVLSLAVKSDPPMLTGNLLLKAKLELPPIPDECTCLSVLTPYVKA